MNRHQITACQELLKKMDLVLKSGENSTKRGFFKEDIFCDGGTFLAIIPGLTEFIKNSELKATKTMKAGKKLIDSLKISLEEDESLDFKKKVLVTEKHFKELGKREKYVKLAGSKVAVSLYTLRRIKIISGGEFLLTFNKPETPVRFDSRKTNARGIFTPVRYLEDVFPEIGERIG